MCVSLFFTKQQHDLIRAHLFKGRKEEGCFLFATSNIKDSSIELNIKDIHWVEADGWSYQSSFHLELSEEEKVRIMQKARRYDSDLIECHSHRSRGPATFSSSDRHGLDEFIQYIWWKLPDKIYGALVFTKTNTRGQIWLPKKSTPIFISEIKIIDDKKSKKQLISREKKHE